eukprot:SAG31_NODE_47654_length_229_cov_48.653846_1_plen_31_part_01
MRKHPSSPGVTQLRPCGGKVGELRLIDTGRR